MKLHAVSMRLAGAALLLLTAGAPAAAASPEPVSANDATVAGSNARPSAPGHATRPSADEPKKICRDIAQTNSRLRTTRVCLTRQQWRNAKYN